MEEKISKTSRSIWSIFDNWSSNKFFPKRYSHSKNPSHDLVRGFSLIEIVVVVAILGILISGLILLINPREQLGKSSDARRKADLKQIQAALELYRADNGYYPNLTGSIANCPPTFSDNCASPEVVYLQTVPKDPKLNRDYYYCTDSLAPCSAPPGGYKIFSCLENTRDSDPNKLASTSDPIRSALNCSSGSNYYFVQSP